MENENNNLLISNLYFNGSSISDVYNNTSNPYFNGSYISDVYNNTSNPYYNVELSGTPSQIVWYDNDPHNTYYNTYYNSGTQLNTVPSQMWYKDASYQHRQITTQEKLDSIDIIEIEKYLRQKKLDNINKK